MNNARLYVAMHMESRTGTATPSGCESTGGPADSSLFTVMGSDGNKILVGNQCELLITGHSEFSELIAVFGEIQTSNAIEK